MLIMEEKTHTKAIFANLVYSEEGEPVEVTFIGTEPNYVIMDDGFKRHVPAEQIDRQVVEFLAGQVEANKDLVTEGVMGMLGKDDLFTKAMIDSSIGRMDEMMNQGIPDDARMMLGMMGFKIIVNIHGEVVDLEMPAQELPGSDEDW